MSLVEMHGAGWRWVEVDGGGWRWVHGLVIPILFSRVLRCNLSVILSIKSCVSEVLLFSEFLNFVSNL